MNARTRKLKTQARDASIAAAKTAKRNFKHAPTTDRIEWPEEVKVGQIEEPISHLAEDEE